MPSAGLPRARALTGFDGDAAAAPRRKCSGVRVTHDKEHLGAIRDIVANWLAAGMPWAVDTTGCSLLGPLARLALRCVRTCS